LPVVLGIDMFNCGQIAFNALMYFLKLRLIGLNREREQDC
jgi:hypothetical protein